MTVLPSADPLQRIRGSVSTLMEDQLLRRGTLLTSGSAITAIVGLAYWTLAAHDYSPSDLGRNSAAISAMMFLAGVAQLNLMSALVRFLPVAGRSTVSFVRTVYAITVGTAFVLAVGFLAVITWVAPNLRVLVSSPPIAVGFVASTMVWTVFVLQDSVLTGLNRTWLVPVENGTYAIGKLVLLVVMATLLPGLGIFVSWTLALLLSVIPVTAFLFWRAMPTHQRNAVPHVMPPTASEIRRFAAADYGGALCWMAAINLLPVVVLDLAGAGSTGLFSVSWVIAYSLYLVSANMGTSLVVESAGETGDLTKRFYQVVAQTTKLIAPVVAVLVIGAPEILRLFGSVYSDKGSTVLRLLVLSAIPNVVTASAVSVMRAQSKTGLGAATLAVLCSIVFLLSALLVPSIGIDGIGVAWLVAQTVTAGVLLLTRSIWLPGSGARRPGLRGPQSLGRFRRSNRLVRASLDRGIEPIRASDALPEPTSWSSNTPKRAVSDLAVATLKDEMGGPVAVLKVAGSQRAADDLRASVAVLREIQNDRRMTGWIPKVPTVLASDLSGEPPYVIESYLDGVDGRTLRWNDPRVAQRAVAAAVAAITDLQGRSAREAHLDDDWLKTWVDIPAARVAGLLRPSGWRTRVLDGLTDAIRGELTGKPAELTWTHGDYVPGNLLLSPEGDSVRGVVDWGGASSSGIGPLDVGLLLLATRMLSQRRELGEVVADVIGGAGLTPDELAWLAATGPDAEPRHLILLCWLRHISDNLRKSDLYRHHPVWRARNVDVVLRKVGVR
jgi:O-antigen/teichoic acid export membrane protein